MLRRMYQGGSSAKKGPRIAIREQDVKLPRDANVRACEWPSDDFMVEAGFKEEFEAYVYSEERTVPPIPTNLWQVSHCPCCSPCSWLL